MSLVELFQTDDNNVVVKFTGKLTRDNSEEAEEKLTAIRKENPQGHLIFDFEELDYISSAGLRVLLNSSKSEKTMIKIINVNSIILETFSDTSFIRLFDVQKSVKQYSLENLELIGQGANGAVYRIDNENIVKVFNKTAPIEMVEREREMAQEALISGVPTAISYSLVMVDGCYGIVFELIDSETLSRTMVSRPDDYDKLVDQYVSLYKSIHNIKAAGDKFPSIKQIYFNAIEECRDDYTEEEIGKLRALVESVPDSDTLIHGDYHPNNIMVQNGKLILIDMGDMSRGHIIFDFLATAATQANLVELNPEYAEFHTKMPVELIKKTWRRLLDTYFCDKTEDEKKRIEEQIYKFSKLKVALVSYFGRGAGPEIIQASINDAKANLFPYIDDLIGSINW